MVGFMTPSPFSNLFAAKLGLLPGLPSGTNNFAVVCSSLSSELRLGGCSCLDDLDEARLQDLLREEPCPDCVLDHSLDARFGCDESSQVCKSGRCLALF